MQASVEVLEKILPTTGLYVSRQRHGHRPSRERKDCLAKSSNVKKGSETERWEDPVPSLAAGTTPTPQLFTLGHYTPLGES